MSNNSSKKTQSNFVHDNARSQVAKIVKDTLSTSMRGLITCRVFIRLCSFRLSFISIDVEALTRTSKHIKQ